MGVSVAAFASTSTFHSNMKFALKAAVVLAMLALGSAEDKTEEQAVTPVADQETAAGHYGYWGYPAWGHRYGYYPGHHYGWGPARYGYGYNTPGSYVRVDRHRRSAEEPTATVETADQTPEENHYGPYYGGWPHPYGAYYRGYLYRYGGYAPHGLYSYNYRHY